jgi:hypothetical protein
MWTIVLILALMLPSGVAAQTAPAGTPRPGLPPRDTPLAKPATGKIRGRVLAADTNAPLRRAQVSVTLGQIGVRRFTTTDAEGRYEIVELPEGRYNVSASKGGYVTLQYGQRRAFEPGRPVAVAEGQDVSQVDIVLPRGSVITGRITDEFGEPIAGAQVEVQRYQYTPGGQRRLTFAGGGSGFVQTDDRGEFRAYGLMPGEYVVSSIVRRPMFQQSANPNDASEGFAPTYYPGTPNPAEAQLVEVGLAQEISIHMALQAARMARVSGTVVNSEGKPVVGVRLMIRTASGSGMFSTGGLTGADGSFLLANVPPGDHYIDAIAERRPTGATGEIASVPLTVASEDITNLRITTGRAAVVTGTVVFEGSSPRQGIGGGLRMTANSADPQEFGGPLIGMGNAGLVEDDGRFEVQGVGKVLFRAVNLGPWMLKRVTLEGEDITDTPYELRAGTDVAGLRVVLTDRMTDLSGSVKDDRSQALKEFVVVVQPARDVDPPTLPRFLRTARPDQDGRFGVRGIPPGDYVATAVEALEQGGEWNPEYRMRLRDAGRRFSVKEGESIQLDLELASGL